jgi:hypothetical protein
MIKAETVYKLKQQMKLHTNYYKIQAKHDEGKCQYDTQLNNYSRNFSVRHKIFRTDKTNQPV